jgi:serine/threonine protein kinase
MNAAGYEETTLNREIKALQRISHPNIVELHEVINDKKSPNLFLITQYLEGVSMDELEKKATKEEMWKWSRQLVSALHMCHNMANIAHRDIKPENLKLKNKEKDLVLYDFGSSSCFEDDNDLVYNTSGT